MRHFVLLALSLGLSLSASAIDCYVPSRSALDFTTLRRDIQNSHLTSAEQLLEYFAKTPRYQELVRYPVLERISNALHADNVTPRFPRIVMHAGNLTMHLIGDPSAPGHDLIEVTEFVPAQARFAFHVINFRLNGLPEMFLENIDDGLEVSKPVQELYEKTIGQFATCNDCHALGTRGLVPNWSPRSSLFKAYGTADDRIPYQAFRDGLGGDPGSEGRQFQDFLKTRDDTEAGRLYRWLDVTTKPNTLDDVLFPNTPNRRLNDALYAQVRYQLAREISEDTEYARLQYAIVGAFFDCDDLPGFLPSAYRTRHEAALADRSYVEIPIALLPGGPAAFAALARPAQGFPQDLIAKGTAVIEEGAAIRARTADSIAILTRGVAQINSALAFFSGRGMPYWSLSSPGSAPEADFVSEAYSRLVAKIRYIVEPHLKHGLNFPGESLGGPGQDDAARSYRMDGGSEGLLAIASCHLGAPFLQANPDLDYFATGKPFTPTSLTIPRAQFCAMLREKSLAALHTR